MKMELALADADAYAPDTLARIREQPRHAISSCSARTSPSASPAPERIRLDARLQDSRAGQTLALVSETGPEADVLDAGVAHRRPPARTARTSTSLPAGAAAEVQASQPATVGRGAVLRRGPGAAAAFDALGARDLLERAVAADATFPAGARGAGA